MEVDGRVEVGSNAAILLFYEEFGNQKLRLISNEAGRRLKNDIPLQLEKEWSIRWKLAVVS